MKPPVYENHPLKSYNTFGVEASARYFVEIAREEELVYLFTEQKELLRQPVLVLGGGSNMLFTRDFEGLVIHIMIKGITHETSGPEAIVTAGGGIIWNDLVWYCVDHGFGGIENLALIPGTAGAAPIQNIGAYGTELKDVFVNCRVFDTHNVEFLTLGKQDCKFAYRDSVFKQEAKGRYIVTQVTLKLSLNPVLNTTYGAIEAELARRNIRNPSIRDIAEVVSSIRTDKLPDPATIGNSGSFFKNPIISAEQLKTLQLALPDTDFVYYPVDSERVKLAAGWLIEQCGWKGKRVGDTGTWKNQALVLVNHNKATGADIYNLSEQIISDVKSKFGITLEREVNLI